MKLILIFIFFTTYVHAKCSFKCSSGDFDCYKKLSECRKKTKKPKNTYTKIPYYSRKKYDHWIDEDRDCQKTRSEILIRDSLSKVKFYKRKRCNVKSGKWKCPLTGRTYTSAKKVSIDHLVPLKHAHYKGAYKWSYSKKRKFANDPSNLLVTQMKANKDKGHKGPVKWKPYHKPSWCMYCLLYTSPSPRDATLSRMPSSA